MAAKNIEYMQNKLGKSNKFLNFSTNKTKLILLKADLVWSLS